MQLSKKKKKNNLLLLNKDNLVTTPYNFVLFFINMKKRLNLTILLGRKGVISLITFTFSID